MLDVRARARFTAAERENLVSVPQLEGEIKVRLGDRAQHKTIVRELHAATVRRLVALTMVISSVLRQCGTSIGRRDAR